MTHSPITLIGFGVAGQFLLSHILEVVPGYKVTIVDPDFMGGDLARYYSAVQSNTKISQKVESISKLPSVWSETVDALKKRGGSDDTVLLANLISDIRLTGNKLTSRCSTIYDKVSQAIWNPDTKIWTLVFASGRASQTASIVCFCTGMTPRQEDYGIPIIPLSTALDQNALMRVVNPGQRVTVLGSAHSATLVLKHLNSIPAVTVTCIYRGSKFKFARDGAYSGIKKESADIADAILRNEYTGLTMIKSTEINEISKTLRKSDWIVQASGFQATFPEIIILDGATFTPAWDSNTGLDASIPQAQAFGACVPGVTEKDGNTFPDISLSSFVDQLTIRWPLLKSMIQNLL